MPDLTSRFPFSPVQPGAYSAVDASGLIESESSAGAPVVAIVGACTGGEPNKALPFSSPQALKSILRSGAAFDCARFALAKAARVIVVRAGNAITQATRALAGATTTPVTLTAKDYGAWTNAIRVTVEANNKVTIVYTDANGVTFTEVFAAGAAATAADVVALINGTAAGAAQPASAFVTAAVTAGNMPLTVAAQSALTGGSDGALVAGDWTTGLQILETQDVSVVCVATGDATVHAQAVTHCDAMSTTQARRERTAILGGAAGENVATVAARMASLRNRRVKLVYPGVKLYDVGGTLTDYAPFYAAALEAGEVVALPDPATSRTHGDVNVIDVERRLSTIAGGDVDQLLAANVSPIGIRPGGGFWLIDSLSGYQADASFRDFHKTRTADESQRRLRERLEAAFVGKKALNRTADSILRETIAELDDQVTEELLRAYRTPEVTVSPTDARTYLVTVPVMLPETTKFILLTLALQPPSTAVAGSASDTLLS